MNIGVVYNAFTQGDPTPEEREMRETGLTIGRHLAQLGHNVQYFDMDNPESIDDLCHSQLDVAFNTCERIHGDARGEAYAAALLEYLGIPHTRTHSWMISLGINKVRVKSILSYYHIPTPRFQVFDHEEDPLDPALRYPLFVKGLTSENSIGIDDHSLVQNSEHLAAKVRQILREYRQPALVEEYIEGREFSVAILPGPTPQALPISEILFCDLPRERRFLDYSSKWFTESERYQKTIPVCPANVTEAERQVISQTALRSFEVLELDSYARVDMRYRDHIPYVLEVNQNPSISERDSGFVRTCKGVGLDYVAMVQALLRNAITRKYENLPVRTSLR